MANYKDNNADLGNQTIGGTEPPYALDAEIIMPDGSSQPIPAPEAEDEPVIILAEPVGDEPIVTPVQETIVTPPPEAVIIPEPAPDDAAEMEAQLAAMLGQDEQPAPDTDNSADLDAQLAAMLSEQDEQPSVDTDNSADLDAQLAAMLSEQDEQPAQEEQPDIADLDAQLAAMLEQDAPVQSEQPVEMPSEPEPDERPAQAEEQDDAARAMMEQAQALMEQAKQAQQQAEAQMQAAMIQEQARQAVQAAQQSAPPPQQHGYADDKATEAARAMVQQAQIMMQQAQAAQLQAQQAAQQAQIHAAQAAQPAHRGPDPETEAARIMMEQSKRLMEQAQAAQLQAQQAAQIRTAAQYASPDPYALKEVDRLKNELDGMRELVNKLTFAMSQSANSGAQAAPPYGYNPDRDQYRRLETELDKMRRDIMEKDLRDREKELDRRQKEAETVRDIRPEMMQMSDSREVAPIVPPQNNIGGEYIPIANGVYYSTKDKQVYVMTPASGAASANPTIERPKASAKQPAARPRQARPARAARRRPAGPMRRRPGPRRPRR